MAHWGTDIKQRDTDVDQETTGIAHDMAVTHRQLLRLSRDYDGTICFSDKKFENCEGTIGHNTAKYDTVMMV